MSRRRERGVVRGAVGRALQRLRHFRGHGVHSPYIYNIVRDIFMRRGAHEQERLSGEVVEALSGLTRRGVAEELSTIYIYSGYGCFAVDPDDVRGVEYAIFTSVCSREQLLAAEGSGTTVVILHGERWGREVLNEIVGDHPSTSVLRRGYLMLFNNHLPKQHFTL